MTKRTSEKSQLRARQKKSAATSARIPDTNTRPGGKLGLILARIERKTGAAIDELVDVTGWQAHSVRGAISGALRKKLGLAILSEKVDGRGRVYRIVERG